MLWFKVQGMMGVKIIYQLKSQLKSDKKLTIIYPDSDGKPIADNTKQFRWISIISNNDELT